MNPKIKKAQDELERTKAKIVELQALMPQLERNIIDMENTEIVRLVRSANIALADFPAFIASLKQDKAALSVTNAAPTETGGDTYVDSESSRLDEEDRTDV